MIMHSQTNLCYKRPSSSENIIGTKTNWKFSPTAVTMTLDKQSTLHFSLTWCTIKLSWSQKTKQFWRYSQNIQILIIYAMTLTVTLDLTLKIAASCRTLELIMMPHLQQFWLGKIQPHWQMERWTQRQMDMIKKEKRKKRDRRTKTKRQVELVISMNQPNPYWPDFPTDQGSSSVRPYLMTLKPSNPAQT